MNYAKDKLLSLRLYGGKTICLELRARGWKASKADGVWCK